MNSNTQEKARLFETPGNPAPEGGTVDFIETNDGVRLRYAVWPSARKPVRGSIVLLHGRSECIEKYFETVADLTERGFCVLTFDWRGQGGSDRLITDRRRGYVEHFNQYLEDLETILIKTAMPDCRPPFFLVGHSTGGLVALLAGPALENRIQRIVLASPLLALTNLPVSQNTLRRLAGVLSFLGFGRSYVTKSHESSEDRPFEVNKLTSDPVRYRRNQDILKKESSLVVGASTVAWIFAACRAMAKIHEDGFADAISVPTLLIGAGNDAIVDTAEVEAFGRRMRSGSNLTISGARHELFQEKNLYREQLIAAIDAFLPQPGRKG